MAAAVVLLVASVAGATTITYQTLPGESVGGQPVAARATFVTGADGSVHVTLTNLQANPTSVIQNLSDLAFGFDTPNTDVGILTSSSGAERTVAADGSFTDGATVATGWAVENFFAGGLRLHVLGTPTAPTHTIIVGPGGGGTYSNANNSIAGNVPHNPFLHDSAEFDLHVPFVTADSNVVVAIFSFGTEEGPVVPGVPLVPEPSTGAIFALGAIVMATLRRRGMTGRRA